MTDDRSISELLSAAGYMHQHLPERGCGIGYHAIVDMRGHYIGHMTAHDAVKFLESLDA